MKNWSLIISLLFLPIATFAAPNHGFEQDYASLLDKFHKAQEKRNSFISKYADVELNQLQKQQLKSIDCENINSELNYNNFVLNRFEDYTVFMKKHGHTDMNRELMEMDREALLEQKNDPEAKCK